MSTYVTNTRLTTQNIGLINPVVTGEPAPPGALDFQDLGSSPLFDFSLADVPVNNTGLNGNKPWAILTPGWSLVVIAFVAAQTSTVSFYWEAIFPDDLISPRIGDPEIDY